MPEYIPVAQKNAVPEGRGITVFAGGRNVALFNMAGEFFALDGVCPHKAAPLGEGFCEEGVVSCPMHGWRFDVRTGACVDFPNKPAEKLPLRLNGETIEVAL